MQAFGRNLFSAQAALPARTKVRRLGPGYTQDFNPVDKSTAYLYTLAKPDSQTAVWQMCCQILALHGSIGGFTGQIAYPLADPIDGLLSLVDATAGVQQNFEGGHAIVLHKDGAYSGQAFFIRDPYVTRWRATPALAFPIGQERAVTSRFSTTGIQQDFQGGGVIQITSGARAGQVYAVSGPAYARYAETGGSTSSFLGLPIGDELTISGRQRQNFEGGYIQYTPGSSLPAEARAPVASVLIDAAPVSLQVGNVIQRTAQVVDAQNALVTDRPVTWSTSNRSVVTVEASGATATLRAVGAGFANVVAIVDGISSGTLRITVTSACCLPGEGAPTPAVQRAFQDALSRNNITPRLPADNPVRRAGQTSLEVYGRPFRRDRRGDHERRRAGQDEVVLERLPSGGVGVRGGEAERAPHASELEVAGVALAAHHVRQRGRVRLDH